MRLLSNADRLQGVRLQGVESASLRATWQTAAQMAPTEVQLHALTCRCGTLQGSIIVEIRDVQNEMLIKLVGMNIVTSMVSQVSNRHGPQRCAIDRRSFVPLADPHCRHRVWPCQTPPPPPPKQHRNDKAQNMWDGGQHVLSIFSDCADAVSDTRHGSDPAEISCEITFGCGIVTFPGAWAAGHHWATDDPVCPATRLVRRLGGPISD